MRIVQPSVAKRITFATFARKNGLRRHSSVTYHVPDDLVIPAALLAGAQIDGKPYVEETKPKRRTRKPKPPEPVEEPVETVDEGQEQTPSLLDDTTDEQTEKPEEE